MNDYSTVAFPTLNQDTPRRALRGLPRGGQRQGDPEERYLTPNRAACGSCHDNVNFATGENHANLPQVSDNQCAHCHIPQGELEFDISIKGAHAVPELSPTLAGINFDIKSVTGKAGEKPTVTFTVTDNAGQAVSDEQLRRGGRAAAAVGADTGRSGSRLRLHQFGSDQRPNGYVSEDPTKMANCDCRAAVCTYQFQHAIPANATGTYSVGIEGRHGLVINPGTTPQRTGEYGGANKVFNFSVDGSPVVRAAGRWSRSTAATSATATCGCTDRIATRSSSASCATTPARLDVARRPN